MIWLYNTVLLIAVIISSPYWLLRLLLSSTWRAGCRQRLGFDLPVQANPVIWLHAASVGEVKIAEALVKKLQEHKKAWPIVVSVITPTGFEQAKTNLAGLAEIIFAPLDLPFIVPRYINKLNPVLLGIIETELWPNLITAARKKGVKIILLNGRLSDRSYPTYQKFKLLFGEILRCLDHACVQTGEDKERFVTLGIPEQLVSITDNIKYDFVIPSTAPAASIRAEYLFGPGDLVWVAGSTRNDEESLLLKAFQDIRKKVPNLKLVLAPRHLGRIQEIKELLRDNNILFSLYSQKAANPVYDCLLIDTMGELLRAYSIADVVFIGGSLANFGGQNILEPAALAKPVICGPDMRNFKEITAYLLQHNAVIQVKTPTELTEKTEFLLTHPEAARLLGDRARESLIAKKGALDKNMAAMERLLVL
ncbi:MAG: 3-deoxy-D-manno-octulosonic acid transferase [bacterium]|jgi:3-deoxy-D-manno-octulosonic-acid transferase|nr:3-deoxy-D-manno-octulosonic acid transferase [bacterium]